jgi:hypothetical protein
MRAKHELAAAMILMTSLTFAGCTSPARQVAAPSPAAPISSCKLIACWASAILRRCPKATNNWTAGWL